MLLHGDIFLYFCANYVLWRPTWDQKSQAIIIKKKKTNKNTSKHTSESGKSFRRLIRLLGRKIARIKKHSFIYMIRFLNTPIDLIYNQFFQEYLILCRK